MTENRFFTFIWRFNGLMIAIAATLIVGILIWELTRDWRRDVFPTQATEVLNVDPAEPQAPQETVETTRLGAPSDTATRGVYALPLYVDQTYSNRGISKETGGNRTNYLIIDTADKSQRWLFEGSARLITDVRPLWHTPNTGPRQFLGHLIFVIDSDASYNAVSAALARLEDVASKEGYAIGVGTGLAVTLDALGSWARDLSARNILLVPASALYRPQAG